MKKAGTENVLGFAVTSADSPELELQYLRKISERSIAKILSLDAQSITIRHELELKRRGFALLAELSVSLRNRKDYENVFISVARRINAALNMQRTAVLTPGEDGRFRATVLHGYPQDQMECIASRQIDVDAELLDQDLPVLVTGADPVSRLAGFRETIGIPYMIASPAFLYDDTVAAILITGRTVEADPFLSRLSLSDVETVQAISALLAAVLVEHRLEDDLYRARDQAEKSARVKGEFLANVSHEVRTPMNAILGMTRILSESSMTVRQRQYLDNITRSTRLLLRVFEDILDFSNLDNGRITLQTKKFSLRNMMRSVRCVMEEHAKNKSLSLKTFIKQDVPDAVLGDSARIEQVLINLTGNAIKFTNSGHVHVRVSRQEFIADTVRLLFEVEDTGTGMSEQQIAEIFLPFTQADASLTRKYGGTGLGLAICRSLVSLMQGELRCESQLDKGSKFSFIAVFGLPKEMLEAGEAEDSSPQGEDAAKSADTYIGLLKGMRVLLAEDNEINQLVTVDMLSGMDVDVTVAKNGLEAIRALENGTYDLVLMDIQMPEMDGLTAAARIRSNPKYKNLPIVALTAHALPEDREASLKSGMNDHITKPIEPEQIFAALQKWRREIER